MKYQQKLKGLFRSLGQFKKSLIFLIIVLLAAVLTASVATAFPKSISTSNISVSASSDVLQKGAELFQAEQFSEAAKVWQQAATAWQKSGDKLNQAQALSYLSLAEQKLGNWQAATQAIDSSLSLISSSRSQKSYTLILAKALNAQAHLQLATGKTAEALKNWQEAAANYLQVGDLEGVIGSQINQAQAMQSLGLYRRAKTILEEIEVELINQPNSLIKATVLRSLGNALRVTGELEKSRKLLEESLRVAQEVNLPSAIASAHFSLGNTARSIVNKARQENESKATIETESQLALAEYQKVIETSTSSMLRTIAQLSLFSLLVENRELQPALELRSQIKLNELPASRRSVYARINFAESLIRYNKIIQAVNAGETAETECVDNRITVGNSKVFPHLVPDLVEQIAWSDITEILTTSLQQSRNLKDRQAESYSLGKLAELYALVGKTQESYSLTKQALALSQAVNAADISYRWQWKLGEQLKTQDDAKGAIAAYNTALETLKSLRGDLVAVNPNNPDVQFSFRESVEPVYRELVELLISGEGEVSQENLRQARQVIESLQLAELDNFFQEACLDAKPVEIDQVDNTAAVIYPIILPDRLAVIVALPDKELPLRYYATLKSRCEIETLINELRDQIGRETGNKQQVLRISQQVYDLIIRQGEADLKNSKAQTLVFVLDGVLRNIPMAALHDGKQYLIEKYSLAVTPGLKLLPAQPLKQGKIQILAAGLSEARQNFSALPNVKTELNEIQQQVNSPVLLIDEQFTTLNLEQQIKSSPFPIVHIATHGQFGSQAEKTFILAWDDKINVKQLDTLLGEKDKRGNRPIELLVLSACETAQGDKRAALGIAGVALRAGARSTIATLWKVNDESTAILMVRFYQELLKGDVTKAEALRRAQLSLLQEDKYKLPYFWTPYVLVGNWR